MLFGEFYWVEIVYALIGSFFGFVLALLMDNGIKKGEEKNKIQTVLATIKAELDAVKRMLESSGTDASVMIFSTYVWQSVSASDFFTTLLHKETEKCSLLIEIYSELDAIREIQEKYPDMTEAIAAAKADIILSIDKFNSLSEDKKA